METLALHVPMAQPYPILLLNDGDCAYPSVQLEFMSRWEERVAHHARLGNYDLAIKMQSMGSLVEWPIVDMQAPPEVAKIGMDGMGEVVWGARWPGKLGGAWVVRR